ncbi:MAG: hypothetical protein EOO09_00765 [Chitinophagaceae bacterium]|nr:MAG: hypothetical protein EOO09_00765 [Chitinophagaceae bacterium]
MCSVQLIHGKAGLSKAGFFICCRNPEESALGCCRACFV